MIDISKMDKAEVLAKLYNASQPMGLGMFNYKPEPMTVEEARKYIDDGQTYFDYLKGRVMKVNLANDQLNPALYDRDNGQGAAAFALGVK
jgi:hypothetical protein